MFYVMSPLLSWYKSQTKASQTLLQTSIPYEYRYKNLQQIQWHLESLRFMARWDLIPESQWMYSTILTDGRTKDTSHFKRQRESIWQSVTPFMIKTQKHGLEGNFLNRTKGIYKKTKANIILHGERITFSSKVRNFKVVHFHSFYSTLYCRSNPAVKQEKNKKHPGGKGRNKVIFICRWDDSMLKILSDTHIKHKS